MKTARFQILKPVNEDWDVLGQVLRDVQYETWKASNKAIQLSWEYSGFSSDYKNKFNEYPKSKEILSYSGIHGYAYNKIKDEYTKLNTGNLSQTIKNVADKWKTSTKDVLNGRMSVPSYKKNCAIDVVKNNIKINKMENKYISSIGLISKKYRTEIGKEKNGVFDIVIIAKDNSSKTILDRVISGDYSISASKIVKDTKNKWYLNLSYSGYNKNKNLDNNIIMGIDMGIVYPVVMAFNNSMKRQYIHGSEIDKFRSSIDARRRQILQQSKHCGEGRKGHGRNKLLQPIEPISEKVKNFRDTCNHKYSRTVVDVAIKNGCGTIQMEDLSGISGGKQLRFLKNWTYYDLQKKIEYKAIEHGIEVKYIKPEYTSQRCSKCGYIDRKNRKKQSEFLCLECGFEANADYNAAVNIATPGIEAIIKNTKIKGDDIKTNDSI